VTEQEYIESGAIEAFVLGIATPDEVRELEQMKQLYPAVAQAIARFEEELEQKSLQQAVPPPASVKPAIWNAIGLEDPINSGRSTPVVQMQSTARKSLWKQYAAAASVAIALGSLAMNFILMNRVKQAQTEVVALKEKANTPQKNYPFFSKSDITPVAMYGVGTHAICRCSLYWDKKEKKAYLMIHHLADQSEEKDYQAWALVDGKPVSIGVFRMGDKSIPIQLENIPEGASVFAVTLEKKGGSPTPTLEEMYLKGQIST
jgi:anti-sigma-K factor RskA